MRFDSPLGDVEAGCVRERAFQAVSDLNEHLPVLNEHEQNRAIAFIFLTNAPRLRDALRISCDIVVTLHFWKHGDDDLIRSLPLELRELFVKSQRSRFRNHSSI